MPVERELLRYRMFRFASRVGFSPPYLHHRKLRGRLGRFRGPSIVIAGREDHLVPLAHARAYAEGLGSAELRLIAGAGNSVAVERPSEGAAFVRTLVEGAGLTSAVA
jgi:pimeloyl-ACP methyl ester carboxylesterase